MVANCCSSSKARHDLLMAVLRASVAHPNGTWFSRKRVCISCLVSSLGVIHGSDIVLRDKTEVLRGVPLTRQRVRCTKN